MKKISINIVNWNGIKHIENCLDSVYEQDYEGEVKVVIIDNGSTDGSLDLVEAKYPSAKIVRNRENLGFCKAHNQAFRINNSDYCMPLNYDIVLEKNFLSEMMKAVESEEGIGMVSGKLYRSSDGKPTRTIDSTGIDMPFYFQTPRGELSEDVGQFNDRGYIFGPCGAAPLYKRDMLEDIKIKNEYLDENFNNYVEDVDLAWRAQLKGWKCIYTPRAVAYHVRGATRKNNQEALEGYYSVGYRNRYWAMYKNITKNEAKRHFLKILLKETVFLLTKKTGACSRKVVLRSFRDAFRGRKIIAAKREIIQNGIKVPDKYMDEFFGYNKLNTFKYLVCTIPLKTFKRLIKTVIFKTYNLSKRAVRFILKPVVKKYRKKI